MYSFKITSFNVEGITSTKCDILSDIQADILCLQETHKDSPPPNVHGMHLIIYHGHLKHGSAIYAREKSTILASQDLSEQGMEILRVETSQMTITSVYKPPPTPFSWPQTTDHNNKPNIIIGDFNSHNTIWGYNSTNKDESSCSYPKSNGTPTSTERKTTKQGKGAKKETKVRNGRGL